ncbi:MAG: WYL domain-containing protein, partial [Chloroflexi bacterium]|nr:WYL domain-containing protein [Chloroflexota bacterium]
GNVWHLVCARNRHLRVCRISRVLQAHLAAETFVRPVDFDLAAFWQKWCVAIEGNRPFYPVSVRVSPQFIPWLPIYFGDPIHEQLDRAEAADAEGWLWLTLPFESLEDAREHILGLGGAVEVVAPQALRSSIQDFAEQIVALYAGGNKKRGPAEDGNGQPPSNARSIPSPT